MRPPRIALDLGGLDGLWLGAGLYRYAVDLVHALAALDPPARFVVLGATPEPVPDLRPVFARPGGRWAYRPFARAAGFAAAYRDHARVAAALAAARADLCHCLGGFAPVVAPCPVVVTVHDLMYELFPEYAAAVRSRPYRLFRWAVRRRVRRAVCISRATAADLHRLWGVPVRAIDVVPHGLRAFCPGAAAGRPENPALRGLPAGPVISSPLNLEPRKNLGALLEAFARVRAAAPASLVLYGRAGWGDDRERAYRAHLARLGLTGVVVETGILSDPDLWWLYRRTSVFAFPSLYEGFGYPVVEAMAAGACPVVRGASAMAEVVGPAGVMVEPVTGETLAAAVAGLLADEPRRRALAAAAEARAGEFTARRMAGGTFATYTCALRRAGERR